MMHASRALSLALLLLVAVLAGCTSGGGPAEAQEPTPVVTTPADPTPAANGSSGARFLIEGLVIVGPEGNATLREDDAHALVRYTVRQPADAPKTEAAFVTYLFNGRIVDVVQLKLAPGEEKEYERKVTDLRANKTFRVEVRAGASSAKAEAQVTPWPRAGEDELLLGPLAIRIPFGLVEQDGRALVNLTLDHRGPEQTFRDFRAKTLCLGADGTTKPTQSVRLEAPTLGNSTGADVYLDDCPEGYYGIEFKAVAGEGEIVGRLLLVPDDWRPPQA